MTSAERESLLDLVAGRLILSPLPEDVLALDDAQALVGPDRDADEAVLDDVFAKSPRAVLQDLGYDLALVQRSCAAVLDVLAAGESVARIVLDGEPLVLRTIPSPGSGLCALDGSGALAGLFVGCDLVVATGYRGRGLGTVLVALRLVGDGDLPTWHHDEPGYSFAGAACVAAGMRLLRDARAFERSTTP